MEPESSLLYSQALATWTIKFPNKQNKNQYVLRLKQYSSCRFYHKTFL